MQDAEAARQEGQAQVTTIAADAAAASLVPPRTPHRYLSANSAQLSPAQQQPGASMQVASPVLAMSSLRYNTSNDAHLQ